MLNHCKIGDKFTWVFSTGVYLQHHVLLYLQRATTLIRHLSYLSSDRALSASLPTTVDRGSNRGDALHIADRDTRLNSKLILQF